MAVNKHVELAFRQAVAHDSACCAAGLHRRSIPRRRSADMLFKPAHVEVIEDPAMEVPPVVEAAEDQVRSDVPVFAAV